MRRNSVSVETGVPSGLERERRESIKDHLLKFKAKAEKILESNASNRVTSPTVQENLVENLKETEESKKEQLRNRIRKNAQKAVERTRGNVQLNRRLARKPTISTVDEIIDEKDIKAIDEQIEKCLEIGKKFVENDELKLNQINLDEFIHGTQNLEVENNEKNNRRNVCYGRIIEEEHNHNLVRYVSPEKFGIESTPEPCLYRRIIETDDVSYYSPPEHQVIHRVRRKKYTQFDVFIDSIHLDEYSLWSEEEYIASQLRNEYFSQILRVHRMTQIKSYQLDLPMEDVNKIHEDIIKGKRCLRKLNDQLLKCRDEQKFTATNIRFTDCDEDDEDWTMFGKVTNDGKTTPMSKICKEERDRVYNLKKTSIQLVLFYNDMEVDRTGWLPISTFLIPVIRRFELEVYTPAESVNIVVMERQAKNGNIQEIGNANVPLPNESDESIALNEAEFISHGVRGRILCRSIYACGEFSSSEGVRQEKSNTTSKKSRMFENIPKELRLTTKEHLYLMSDESLLERNNFSMKRSSYKCALDVKIQTSINYINQLKERVLEEKKSELKFEEIVREVPIPSLSVAFSKFFTPADESRRLKPMRKDFQSHNEKRGDPGNSIVINIQSAFNLPKRRGTEHLQPFVVIRLGKEEIRTNNAIGSNPSWQFTTKLHLTDESKIVFLIYDQTVEQLPNDDRLHNNIVYERLSSHLIAKTSLNLPLDFKINSTICLSTPVYSTNYVIDPNETAFMKILVSSDTRKNILTDDYKTSENLKVVSCCKELINYMNENHVNRVVQPLVSGVNGTAQLCCRYLKPVEPPPSLASTDCIKEAARTVASMPRSSHDEIWMGVEVICQFCVCSITERAILLCCWLMARQHQCYLISGHSAGEKCAFVYLKGSKLLIDATSGKSYPQNDPTCPLYGVVSAFNETNFYANVQTTDVASNMSFNFKNSNYWKPLLSDGIIEDMQIIENRTNSVMNMQYSLIGNDDDKIIELRAAIEREIKLKFDEQRPFAIPQWNLMASKILRDCLDQNSSNSIIEDKLSRLRESYNVNISIWNEPYISIEKCVDGIISLKFHENPIELTQFALTVHIESLFSHVLRVIIAIGSLQPK